LRDEERRFAFGNLDGDGGEDAAVILTYVDGNAAYSYLAAVLNENGVPVHAASAFLGLKIGIDSVAIANEVITVRSRQHGLRDPTCCPTQVVVSRLRLTQNALVLLSESPPGQLSAEIQRAQVLTTPSPTPTPASMQSCPTVDRAIIQLRARMHESGIHPYFIPRHMEWLAPKVIDAVTACQMLLSRGYDLHDNFIWEFIGSGGNYRKQVLQTLLEISATPMPPPAPPSVAQCLSNAEMLYINAHYAAISVATEHYETFIEARNDADFLPSGSRYDAQYRHLSSIVIQRLGDYREALHVAIATLPQPTTSRTQYLHVLTKRLYDTVWNAIVRLLFHLDLPSHFIRAYMGEELWDQSLALDRILWGNQSWGKWPEDEARVYGVFSYYNELIENERC